MLTRQRRNLNHEAMKNGSKNNRMKTLMAVLLVAFCLNTVLAQDALDITPEKRPKITGTIELSIGNDKKEAERQENDTTIIRMGKKEVIIIETGKSKHVDITKSTCDDEWDNDHRNKFDGHWASFDIGVNGFTDENYSLYGGQQFMELNQSKSLEVNLNFLEYNIGLQQNKKNIGLVTGMGISYNNYKFDNPITIKKVNGMVEPISLNADDLEKSKLTVAYLTIPLLLEFQIPVNDHSNSLFIAGGIEGGLNIGSHTKVKWDDSKEKERGGFNLNPFKYAAICKVGLNDISLYATYNLSPLFKENRGPGLTPFSIGISFINF